MKNKHIIYTLSTIPLTIALGNVNDSNAFFGLDSFITKNKTANDIVNIKDKNLLKAINNQLGRGEVLENVTISDMESLTVLDAQERNIVSIEGLEYAINLRNLNLGKNSIQNILPLNNLTSLKTLYLNNNQILDITALSNLTNLNALRIDWNNISDITVLGGLTNLNSLNIGANKICDISSISNLKKLNSLQFGTNKVVDIEPLRNLINLSFLGCDNNQISDISPISNLTNLNTLYLYNNKILNISTLANLTNLTYLHLNNNQISDISVLGGLTNLNTLYLNNNQISDILPISNLTHLTYLHLNDNQILDISPLRDLTNLEDLRMNNNQIKDISSLENLINLNRLNLSNNQISDILILEKLTELRYLYLGNNNIKDISMLGGLINLKELYLNNNNIKDISMLKSLINLNNLCLYYNQIVDISALEKLTSLINLQLYGNQIVNISVLENLINLKELRLGNNKIIDISSLKNLTELTRLELYNNRISDISALKHLTSLTILNLGTILVLEDISPLSNLTALTQLYLDNNKIIDVSPLENLYNLRDLYLHNNKISDISPLKNLTKLTDLKLENQSISISETSEIGCDLSTTYINNPVKGINNEKVNITSISNNGYYQNGKLYWDNMSLGNYNFTVNFSKTYNINGNNVVYSGKANINLEVVDGAGPNISNDSCINEDELSIYVTINAEDLLSDVDYLIHNGEQHQLPYTFKYDIYNRNNNIVEVFDDLGNSSLYEVTPDELSIDTLNQYIDLLESDNNILENISYIRKIVNTMGESSNKDLLTDRINNLSSNIKLDRKTVTSNVDVYIKSENILQMSLDTNSITFEDFSGVEDIIKENVVNVTINSSLPYQLNAYLPIEIQNVDKSNIMDKSILNIKENSEDAYQTFVNTTDKVVLKDNCSAGNDLVHGVDIKLSGGIAHEKDVYKTTIKFEAEQK